MNCEKSQLSLASATGLIASGMIMARLMNPAVIDYENISFDDYPPQAGLGQTRPQTSTRDSDGWPETHCNVSQILSLGESYTAQMSDSLRIKVSNLTSTQSQRLGFPMKHAVRVSFHEAVKTSMNRRYGKRYIANMGAFVASSNLYRNGTGITYMVRQGLARDTSDPNDARIKFCSNEPEYKTPVSYQ